MSESRARKRRSVAVAMLVTYSLYHGLLMGTNAIRNFQHSGDSNSVAALEQRLQPLKERLARAHCGQVGYVTDDPSDPDWFTGFYRFQYALAPILVDDSSDHSLVVANLRNPSELGSVLRNSRLSLVQDYGRGLALLSRQGP